MTDEFELSRRQTLAALGTVGAASAGAGVGTSAFFSDTESFENNRLTAGELDLGVAYTARYSDWSADEADGVSVRMYDGPAGTTGDASDLAPDETGLPAGDDWLVAVDDPERFLANTETGSFPTADGDAAPISCADLPQADDAARPVVDLDDAKPGDFGTITLDFALCDNPGFVWANGTLRDASENGTTEPEADDPDEVNGAVELLDVVQAVVWVDDGDGYVDGETVATRGSLRAVLDELETGPGLALGGDVDQGLGRNCFSADGDADGSVDVHHVSLAWWVPVDHGNEIQSDSVTFDLGLYTEQCRHNTGGVDVATVVERPEMQQLLRDLGHPSPSSPATDGFGAMGPVSLDFGQARTRQLTDPDADSDVYRTVVPSPVGSLRFTSTGSELVVPPAFVFDSDLPETIKAQLDVATGIGWPDGTSAALIGNEGESAFFRPVSPGERSRAEDALSRPVDAGVGFDIAGKGIYVLPPGPDDPTDGTPSLSAPDRLVTDGGTADCVAVPDVLCDPAATGETTVLDAGFDVVASYSDDELATQLDDERQCLNDYIDCFTRRLEQAATVGAYLGQTCVRISLAIQSAFLSGLDELAFELFSRVVPGPQRLLTRFAIKFLTICVVVSGVTVFATAGYFVNRCRVSALLCLGPTRPEPSPSPQSPTFETSTTGNDADATVVSEDLSGGGELDLRVFRCNTTQVDIVYGDLDTALAIAFDFEISRTDAFGEDAYVRVYEDGDTVAETGRDLSIIQDRDDLEGGDGLIVTDRQADEGGSIISGRVTGIVDVDGDASIRFGIESSDFCSNDDHADTHFDVSNLSVERGRSTPPASGEFETSTTGNADATVVSEDLSGGGELDFRVYRCSSAQAVTPLGDLDGTLSLSFDFESRRNDAFWELPYVQVVVDDAIAFDVRQELTLAPTLNDRGPFGNPRVGTVDESIPVDGFVTLVFGIEPSDPCSNFDHEDTFFDVSNLSVGLE
jgi:predicted ribosomally synthesized peptide with SipW-like signal peptide